MVLLCKHRALYVKACIIANGVTDSQGDTLQAQDIKKIFTSFNNSNNFEIYHNEIPIEGVSLLENYIATADESIGTLNVPAGSWLAVIRVDNPDIQERLLKGEFKGVSLNNKIAVECKGSLTGAIRYQDVADAECVIPVYISFVEAGANGYGLHVMDYDAYIQKSKDVKITNNNIGDTIMDLKEFLEGLKSLIQKAEETPATDDSAKDEDPKEKEEETVEVKKEEKPKEEDAVVKKATTKEEDEEDEEDKPAIEKEAEPTTEPSTKEEEAKDDIITQLEERISKLEKIIEELTKEEEDTKEDEKEVKEETDTPKITKSKNVILENQSNTVNTNYYEMTGRDPVTGLKIRNASKIL